MTNYSADTVDKYISDASEQAQSHLNEVRVAIKSTVPDAEEQIRWTSRTIDSTACWPDLMRSRNTSALKSGQMNFKPSTAINWKEHGYKTGKRTFQIAYDQDVPGID